VRTRGSIGVLVCVVCLTTIAGDAGANNEPSTLPPNVSVGPELQDVVADMLRQSGTFRGQCRLLGTMPHVLVRIRLEVHPGSMPAARAQSDLGRHEFGGVTAFVHVWSLRDAIELIARELEHVLEFAAGTNYRMLAVLEPGSVWALHGGAFETTRAVDAGLRVKGEAWPAHVRARR
jgi:hypothetical protein